MSDDLVGSRWRINDSGREFTVDVVSAQYAYVIRDSGARGRILVARLITSRSPTGYTRLDQSS